VYAVVGGSCWWLLGVRSCWWLLLVAVRCTRLSVAAGVDKKQHSVATIEVRCTRGSKGVRHSLL